jgi:HK97 family phage major capsid protein
MPSQRDDVHRSVALGVVRDTDGGSADGPRILEGLAIPYGTPYRLPWGETETIHRGAFRDSVAAWRARPDGARPAYLTRHGGDPVAAIVDMRDTPAGVTFRAELFRREDGQLTTAAQDYLVQVRAGVNGASAEFLPDPDGIERVKDGYRVTRGALLAVAGAHAPAYDQARVAARSTGGRNTMPTITPQAPVDFATRLDTMHTDALAEARSITGAATAEGRELTPEEDRDVRSAQERAERVGRQRTAYAEERERLAQERSAAASTAGSGVHVTRAEPVYRGQAGVSYFRDLVHAQKGDTTALERLARHRAHVQDLQQRAMDSADLGGTMATQYAPELFVPDLAMQGPLFSFFERTPISNALPIVVPVFDTVTGDVGFQAAENDPLPEVELKTKPTPITPVACGGKTIVSRQVVDGASPGADAIIQSQLRELLMRSQERLIATVLGALPVTGTIADTGGTGGGQSGRDLERGLRSAVAQFLGLRYLPAEGVLVNATDYRNLAEGEDLQGRPIMPMIGPVNTDSDFLPGFSGGRVAGVPVGNAWAIASPLDNYVARRGDARSWASTALDIRYDEQRGPESIVFAIWQYFAFAVIQPKGVTRWTYTNTLQAEKASASGKDEGPRGGTREGHPRAIDTQTDAARKSGR